MAIFFNDIRSPQSHMLGVALLNKRNLYAFTPGKIRRVNKSSVWTSLSWKNAALRLRVNSFINAHNTVFVNEEKIGGLNNAVFEIQDMGDT